MHGQCICKLRAVCLAYDLHMHFTRTVPNCRCNTLQARQRGRFCMRHSPSGMKCCPCCCRQCASTAILRRKACGHTRRWSAHQQWHSPAADPCGYLSDPHSDVHRHLLSAMCIGCRPHGSRPWGPRAVLVWRKISMRCCRIVLPWLCSSRCIATKGCLQGSGGVQD